MTTIDYIFADPLTVDCMMLTHTWVEVAFQKDKKHYDYLVEQGFQSMGIRRLESGILENDLQDDEGPSHTILLAMAKKDDAPEEPARCVGYLWGLQHGMFTVEVRRLCSAKYGFDEQDDLTDQHIGSTLLGMYIQKLPTSIYPVEILEVKSHESAVGFWQKMGLESNGQDHEMKGQNYFGMTMYGYSMNHWRENGCAPK